MKSLVLKLISLLSSLRDLPPLFFRAILVHGFYGPAVQKLSNIQAVADWFGSMGMPFPLLNAYMATTTEVLGCVLLTIGLATRFIAVPMMVVMLVAIATVHWANGFECNQNGYEIPFYYFFMLFSLVVTGAGRVSIDHLIRKSNASGE